MVGKVYFIFYGVILDFLTLIRQKDIKIKYLKKSKYILFLKHFKSAQINIRLWFTYPTSKCRNFFYYY